MSNDRDDSGLIRYADFEPELAPGVWIAPGAKVIGRVTIGADSSVWYGCVLRGDVNTIRIGERTNIQDLSMIHVTRNRYSTELGNDVTVGHRAVVHGCRVEDRALIGIGAVILDGAVIGAGALVGAGAVVTPGTEIPPGCLALGTPARVVRELSPAELEAQHARTLHYVDLAREHAREHARETRGSGN